MTRFRVVPVETAAADTIRARRADDHGNALAPIPAPDGAPCRHCLRDAAPGEEVLLLSYSPFARPGPYREVGPIFLHAQACAAYPTLDRVPPVVLARQVQLRAYDARDRIIYDESCIVQGSQAEERIDAMLGNPEARYLHVRTALNGCFLCRVERAA